MKFIDLFSGMGAFHLALSEHECVFASDIDSNARKTYQANFDLIPSGDIREINERDIPEHDILCAGFPCQPFSKAGKNLGMKDKGKGDLFFEIVRIVNYHKPKVLFLENVSNLYTKAHIEDFRRIMYELDVSGYKTFYKTLNSINFGIPQQRNRLYFVAFRKDIAPEYFFLPFGKELNKTVKDFLDKNVSEDYYIKNEKYLKTISDPNNIKKSYISINPKIAITFTARQYAAWTGNFIKDSFGIRELTERELLRLQGFPENYKIVVSRRQIWKQTGNSITVPVLKVIWKKVSEFLNLNEVMLDRG